MLKMFTTGDLVSYTGPLTFLGGRVGRIDAQFYAHTEKSWKYKIKFPGEERPSWFDQSVLQHHEVDRTETGFKLYPADPAPATTLADAGGAVVSATRNYQKAQEALQQALQEEQKREEAQRLADEKKARLQAHRERIDYELLLAKATAVLLYAIDRNIEGGAPELKPELAKFRHELQPLAESHGYAIVPVGDGTLATISVI